jgi:3'(2'), 5'-bisphosphate nucleotidase
VISIKDLVTNVEVIARDAGVAIMQVYCHDITIDYKLDSSPVTEADRLAQDIISLGLMTLTPDIPILSEEAVEIFSGPNDQGFYWLVDPLDGTKEFIARLDEFTVNIALVEKGKPVLGVVYAPALNSLYSAVTDGKAYKVDSDGFRSVIEVTQHAPNDKWKIVSSRSHSGGISEWLNKFSGEVDVTFLGSSLKLCYIAEGLAHLYPRIGPTCFWDIAAAHCILEQAGGIVETFNGDCLNYNIFENFINPSFLARS